MVKLYWLRLLIRKKVSLLDKDLIELAEFYGIEVTEGCGCVIIMPDGTEKPVNEFSYEELMKIMGL